MIYKQFGELRLSSLGLGCMRLPVVDGKGSDIDRDAVARMVETAMKAGINYYDTAWGYHGGNSERVMGEILSHYPRESFYLATKYPGYDVNNFIHVEEIFQEQLKKCRVDYFDFYLFHCLNENNLPLYLDPQYKVHDYLAEQKRLGRIRHIGVSCHCNMETFRRFLEVYADVIEFVQLQLNWVDWSGQDAKSKVLYLRERGIRVWVMEPVRGGGLATLEPEYTARLEALRPEETVPGWAFRFLQTLPDVVMTLSGMSNMEQLEANIKTFCEEKPLSPTEWDTLMQIAAEKAGKKTLACTACRYCTSYCPQGLDIPALIALYNRLLYADGDTAADLRASLAPGQDPAACIGCGACAAVCPQAIAIPDMMKDLAARL